MQYPIVIHKDKNSAYGVIVPDLPGCYSAGDTLEEARLNTVEAIECHIEGLLIDGEHIPEPTNFELYAHKKEYKNGVWVLVDLDLSRLSGKSRRVNITLPERLLKYIDKYTESHGTNRSAFLADAAMQVINRSEHHYL